MKPQLLLTKGGWLCLFCLIALQSPAQFKDIQLTAVSFNYQSPAGTQAIDLWDHENGIPVEAPEWRTEPLNVLNPEADNGLNDWIAFGNPGTGNAAGDNYFTLPQEGDYLYQDFDLTPWIDDIDAGNMSITMSGELKAEFNTTAEGYPYLFGYLMGVPGNPNFINTYMTSNAVKETNWTHTAATYPLLPDTRKVRLFLNRSSVQGFNDVNTAYFDAVKLELKNNTFPAAFVINTSFQVKAEFRATGAVTNADIWADGTLGGLASSGAPINVTFTPVPGESYSEGDALFTVNAPPASVSKTAISWDWKYKLPPSPAIKTMETSVHDLYFLYDQPLLPMPTPWLKVLDFSTDWAAGESSLIGVASQITIGLKTIADTDGDLDYDPNAFYNGGFIAGSYILRLTDFFSDLQTQNDMQVNCYDCAHLLEVFLNSMGIDANAYMIATGLPTPPCPNPASPCYMFNTNYIDPIGNGVNDPLIPAEDWTTTSWTSHVMIKLNGTIYDSCLNQDGDCDPVNLPATILHPVNMIENDYQVGLIEANPPMGPCYPKCDVNNIYTQNRLKCTVQ